MSWVSYTMQRRKFIAATGIAVITTLAGCSGGGDDDETEADGNADGGDETTAGSDDGVTASVTENSIEEFEITEVSAEIDSGSVKTYLNFENTGEQRIDNFSDPPYAWRLSAFDADGNLLDDSEPGVFFWETDGHIGPGETGGINLKSTFSESSETSRVEITVECAEERDDAYC